MQPHEIKKIRQELGLSTSLWGRALGYDGKNVQTQVRQMESGHKPINRFVERLARMFQRHGVPEDFLEVAEQEERTTHEHA